MFLVEVSTPVRPRSSAPEPSNSVRNKTFEILPKSAEARLAMPDRRPDSPRVEVAAMEPPRAPQHRPTDRVLHSTHAFGRPVSLALSLSLVQLLGRRARLRWCGVCATSRAQPPPHGPTPVGAGSGPLPTPAASRMATPRELPVIQEQGAQTHTHTQHHHHTAQPPQRRAAVRAPRAPVPRVASRGPTMECCPHTHTHTYGCFKSVCIRTPCTSSSLPALFFAPTWLPPHWPRRMRLAAFLRTHITTTTTQQTRSSRRE
jgi:hypothetical protein